MEVAVDIEVDRKFRLHREIAVARSEKENFTINITEPPGEVYYEFENATYVVSLNELTRAILDLREGGEKRILSLVDLEKNEKGRIL